MSKKVLVTVISILIGLSVIIFNVLKIKNNNTTKEDEEPTGI
jgi:hypothetical protein